MTVLEVTTVSRLTLPTRAAKHAQKETFKVGSKADRDKEWDYIQFQWFLRDALLNHNGRYTATEEEELTGILASLAYDR
jgi:hypothetical protein